ncbi:4'-phosphopantetheinyl transferase superfamily protein [bacterium]|nr:4'-phosphopantetheinyl transferase superfamily protein [bacterium]
MNLLSEILPVSQKDSSGLKIFLMHNSADNKQTQRSLLRTQLSTKLQENGHSVHTDLLDLLKIPEHKDLSLSLSHCKDYSALAWCLKPKTLGVDIEDLLRLKKETVSRVCTSEEMSLAPRYDLLWSCKEAVFKSLYPSQNIKVLGNVEIFDWKLLRTDTWSFAARHSHTQLAIDGWGEVRLILGHAFAFFIANT